MKRSRRLLLGGVLGAGLVAGTAAVNATADHHHPVHHDGHHHLVHNPGHPDQHNITVTSDRHEHYHLNHGDVHGFRR